VLEISDITGDSFALSQAAQSLDAPRVLLCGVRFMAETVKILSPEKEVVLSHKHAGCPMAEQIDPKRVATFRKEHPDFTVAAYVNTTTELKALSDVCVTSSSAVRIIDAVPGKNILFIPDKNLGAYVRKQLPEKNILLWEGYCYVHNHVKPEMIAKLKSEHPAAKVAIHPECPPESVALADMAGSTAAIISFAKSTPDDVIFVTERGVYDWFCKKFPERSFHQLEPDLLTCNNMKRTGPPEVLAALKGEGGEIITVDEELRLQAKNSIDAMLFYGG